ncbi:MAG: hypothetical protein C5B48_16350 [Candidatus Rokuibacteriota bacterium]|nr:MAG: hypothetical protein C5B48_16350 [Candidatus Rokubacteria bacterium]
MPSVTELVDAWGYAAIFVVVVFGNMGIPVPEETILTVGGYLAWRGQLQFMPVVMVGIVSAVVGDNIGYWAGRHYGARFLARWSSAVPLERMRCLVQRYGAMAVFVARFVAGLRFMAGPLAGTTGLKSSHFFIANLLGAIAYVPLIVGAGYAVGCGLGGHIERLRRAVGYVDRAALIALALMIVAAWIVFVGRARRPSSCSRNSPAG